jgi:hypothetical protein
MVKETSAIFRYVRQAYAAIDRRYPMDARGRDHHVSERYLCETI